MENRILTRVGWEKRVLNKLGVDPAYLSEDVINSQDIITVAEANIIAQIPEYATIDKESDLWVYLENAVVLECCILLCPSMSTRLPKKESGEHASYELGTDWSKKKAEFKEEKEETIMKIIDTLFPLNVPRVSGFTVTFPKRGW